MENKPMARLALAVGLVTAAMLQIELILTRVFSTLFFYHYSFFALSMVMSGLALGGLAAARWKAALWDEEFFASRLGMAALAGAAWTVAALAILFALPAELALAYSTPQLGVILAKALLFLPALAAFGAFLAGAFARRRDWIGPLYAADLAAAALACPAAIALMRAVQGPAALLAPAALACGAALVLLAGRSALRSAALALLLVSAGGIVVNVASEGRYPSLRTMEPVEIERWNEHSRIRVFRETASFHILIDRSAGTHLANIGARPAGAPPPIQPWWDDFIWNLAYRVERPVKDAAIIGVGGGREILGPIAHGARRVDGYELNGIILGLLRNELAPFNNFAEWPEVALHHAEGRVGIRHSGKQYDVIQASLVDTWAATAAGGFVLSENGLYTLEAWKMFLESLSPRGLLTMTRWYVPASPAETRRLTALAAEALAAVGIEDAASRVMLGVANSQLPPGPERDEELLPATIIVSRAPFTPEEVARLAALQGPEQFTLLAAPGMQSPDAVIRQLLDPKMREGAIQAEEYDIRPPTDDRPYFFLLVHPSKLLSLFSERPDLVRQMSYNAVSVLFMLSATTAALALAVLVAAIFLFREPGGAGARAGFRSSAYFMAIGLGYMLAQVALHQRLILVLGHPTYSLSVVLLGMLLGTGLGSLVSGRIRGRGAMAAAWALMPLALAALAAASPHLAELERIESAAGRMAAAGMLAGAVGILLGFGFPLGVRAVAPQGEAAVQKMWAVNGAASVAGSTFAALISLAAGNQMALAAAAASYAIAATIGMASLLGSRGEPEAGSAAGP